MKRRNDMQTRSHALNVCDENLRGIDGDANPADYDRWNRIRALINGDYSHVHDRINQDAIDRALRAVAPEDSPMSLSAPQKGKRRKR